MSEDGANDLLDTPPLKSPVVEVEAPAESPGKVGHMILGCTLTSLEGGPLGTEA